MFVKRLLNRVLRGAC